jgi:hypothetical protein
MIIRLEDSFIQLANKLNKPFLEGDKDRLAKAIELNYNKIFSIISNLEKSKESKPTVIELGNINGRYFALNLYYYQDEMDDDIPLPIKELLPTISPVRLDLMATVSSEIPNDEGQNYITVGDIYDDGDIHTHYVDDVIQEDSGLRSIDER